MNHLWKNINMKHTKWIIRIIEEFEIFIDMILSKYEPEIEKSIIDLIDKITKKLIAWLEKHKGIHNG
jgi:hypothetical protein